MPIRFFRFFLSLKITKAAFRGWSLLFYVVLRILTNIRYWDFRFQEQFLGRDLTEDLGRSD